MTASRSITTTYRALLRLYPRSFREEYGDDLQQLFAEQLRDEPAWRVCGRAILDLAVTVPTHHVEAHMARNRTPGLVALLSLVVASMAFAVVGGLAGIVLAALGTALAALIWRRERPVVDPGTTARWWKLLGSGAVLLTVVIVTTTVTGELSQVAWVVATLALLVSFVLLGAGAVLGLARFGGRRRPGGVAV